MRIGLTIDPLSPLLTGIGRYTWELCRGLRENPDVGDLGFFRYDQWIRKPEAFLSPRRFTVRPPRWVRRLTMRSGFKGRLIHGTNYFLPKRTELGVLTVHDMSVYHYPEMHPPERLAAFEKGFMASLERASHVMTDSHKVRDELIAQTGISPAKVTTVHLGVSDKFAPFSVTERDGTVRRLLGDYAGNYMLCVATFEPRKRIEQAILAHAKLGARGLVPPLVLVGARGWLNEGLHALIERQTARGMLVTLGQVPEADLPFLYAGARLFLYPSIYEGFGLPPIEAMASGVPVIVSDRSCLPEVTQGAAMTINPDDVDAFSEAILRGLEDDNWRREAIDHGIRVAASYGWDKCIENTVDVYRKVWAEQC
jgi:glycosyltransferase involved in cell wall biosynthesis